MPIVVYIIKWLKFPSIYRLLTWLCATLVLVPVDFTEEDQTPSFLRATVVDPTTVTLTWRLASVTCEVLGYIISYEENGMPMLANVSGGQSNELMLKNLQPNTVYVFFVSAITTSGRVLTDDRSVRVIMPAGEYLVYSREGW